jgi:putative peptidoglycan lipid II flippase
MSQMLKSSGAMGVATLTSRVLGMVREMVYSRFMGDGWVAGAFVLAFTIPNLFRRLLGEGALTAAFIPIFKEKEKTSTPEELWRSANAVISGLVVAASVITALAMLGISLALAVHQYNANTDLMLRLLRVMFPYMLLVCLAAVFMGMLNARGHFFIPAMGATMLNVVMIASVLWFTPVFGGQLHQQIFGLAIGVLVAGIAQAAFQLPTLRQEGWRYHWVSPWGDDTVKAVVSRMIPGTIGVAAFQINVLVTQGMAFWVDPQIVASFGYAVRLMELPQGVFGISLATFLLPTLTGLAAEKKWPEFRSMLGQGLNHLIFVNLLATVLLVVLAEPIIRLLFERGKFGPDATFRAAFALQCLGPGLIAFSMVNIFARAFFATGDTTTPMRISLFCLALNLVLAMLLVVPFRQGGLGMANSISAVFNAALLLYAIRRKLGKLELHEVLQSLLGVLGAATLAGIVTWLVSRQWETRLGHENLSARLGAVFAPMIAGALVYGVVAWWCRVAPAREILELIQQKLFKRKG